ncbi:MAG: hypothetical protein NTZ38_00875 [Candidatus Taylorbacteria bacterium]|nr:hypothetical protein [Candidatus Taylorbacteria bacterium]
MNFIAKALLKKQLKGVPDEQVDMIIALVENNPELFKKIADEIQVKIGGGMDQQAAATNVMKAYEAELREVMLKSGGKLPV